VQEHELTRDRITHDLMNQLGIIIGFAELFLAECASDDPRRSDIEEMHSAAGRAVVLVEQLSSVGAAPPDEDR
jgi:signal transduction histidine kinase